MLYIRGRLRKLMGRHLHFDYITGTSVGALNGAFFAATADDTDNQAERLAAYWRCLQMEELIAFRPRDLIRTARLLLGRNPPPPPAGSYSYGGVLDTTGLEQFVYRAVPWRGIRPNLKAGNLEGLAVSATHVGTGHTVVFIDTLRDLPRWSHNPYIRATPASIGPRHALASAAIPVLFPAVKIGKAFYVDGGLRNNTPMSPAIRLGADKLLVISLRHKATQTNEAARAIHNAASPPKPLYLLGKALNSLLLDPTEYDLERMERINSILDAGERAYGPDFANTISAVDRKDHPLRRLKAVHIQPSIDIGGMAADLLARGHPKLHNRVARAIMDRMARNEGNDEADMLSYLLFDGEFAAQLLELGFQDAQAHEEELLKVFGDP